MSDTAVTTISATSSLRPRVGFLGAGRIGRHRMQALVASGCAEVAAIAEPAAATLHELDGFVPEAPRLPDLEALLRQSLDGIVIALPGAQLAEHSIRALERGLPVYCQTPIGRTAAETRAVIDAARRTRRLLAVDLPYRDTEAMRVLRAVVQAGELGDVYAVDLAYHDVHDAHRPRTNDPPFSGTGCIADLGTHLVDLGLWTLGFPRVTRVTSRRYARGELLSPDAATAEDYATALLELDTGATVRLACSWNLPTGAGTAIEARFYGSEGGGAFRNVSGSTCDFEAELYRGSSRHSLATSPDARSGRAVVEWARRVAAGASYDPWVEGLIDVAAALDAIRLR
jgi:predicted dehydrogenase